jgi:sporulation protein YlmC with PRC-barrel domain
MIIQIYNPNKNNARTVGYISDLKMSPAGNTIRGFTVTDTRRFALMFEDGAWRKKVIDVLWERFHVRAI